ncbi:MAG: DnaA regulatory inactivator Hda [Formivibrio sp.]|nr:DnaA regulatory inactivator Hda [Formivibrio sp.]
MKQLVLDLALPAPEPFSDFAPGENAELLFQLGEWAGAASHARFVYLWGETGVGKSHLLAAAARRGSACLVDAAQAPLPEDVPANGLLAVDNVEQLDRAGQETLFAHFNTLRAGGGGLLASGPLPPMLLSLLPDLATRLGWGLVYQLKPLSDADKTIALQRHARQLGFELAGEQAEYLLRHAPRDLASLYRLLAEANELALSRQKAVTSSLLREILHPRAA